MSQETGFGEDYYLFGALNLRETRLSTGKPVPNLFKIGDTWQVPYSTPVTGKASSGERCLIQNAD